MIREREAIERTYRCDIPGCQGRHTEHVHTPHPYPPDCPEGWAWTEGSVHAQHLGIVRLMVQLAQPAVATR